MEPSDHNSKIAQLRLIYKPGPGVTDTYNVVSSDIVLTLAFMALLIICSSLCINICTLICIVSLYFFLLSPLSAIDKLKRSETKASQKINCKIEIIFCKVCKANMGKLPQLPIWQMRL